MSTTPARDLGRGLVTAAVGAAGAVTGFVVAIILTLNLHIFAGVEDGYMATPTHVLERSAWILVIDVVILVAAPLLAVILVIRRRRSRHDANERHVTSPDG